MNSKTYIQDKKRIPILGFKEHVISKHFFHNNPSQFKFAQQTEAASQALQRFIRTQQEQLDKSQLLPIQIFNKSRAELIVLNDRSQVTS